MPAPRRFSRDALQQAALALVDEGGLAALTMRNLASVLGTGPMTIYNYVDSRDGLEALLVEAVLGQIDLSGVPTDDWRADLRAVSEANWRAIRAHSAVIPLMLTRRTQDLASMRLGEVTLDALARSGRSGFALLAAFRTVTAFVHGFAQAELNSPLSRSRGDDPASIIDRIRSLPADDFPRLIAAAHTASESDVEAEFRAGLEIVIAGLG
jgi:AcrR family transcriptional regulator